MAELATLRQVHDRLTIIRPFETLLKLVLLNVLGIGRTSASLPCRRFVYQGDPHLQVDRVRSRFVLLGGAFCLIDYFLIIVLSLHLDELVPTLNEVVDADTAHLVTVKHLYLPNPILKMLPINKLGKLFNALNIAHAELEVLVLLVDQLLDVNSYREQQFVILFHRFASLYLVPCEILHFYIKIIKIYYQINNLDKEEIIKNIL